MTIAAHIIRQYIKVNEVGLPLFKVPEGEEYDQIAMGGIERLP